MMAELKHLRRCMDGICESVSAMNGRLTAIEQNVAILASTIDCRREYESLPMQDRIPVRTVEEFRRLEDDLYNPTVREQLVVIHFC